MNGRQSRLMMTLALCRTAPDPRSAASARDKLIDGAGRRFAHRYKLTNILAKRSSRPSAMAAEAQRHLFAYPDIQGITRIPEANPREKLKSGIGRCRTAGDSGAKARLRREEAREAVDSSPPWTSSRSR